MMINNRIYSALLFATLASSPALLQAESFYPEIPRKEKADFIFFTSKVFTEPAMKDLYFDYVKNFRVCLTNGYTNFEGDDLKELQTAGCELFLYRWFNGYYAAELDPENAEHGMNAEYYAEYPEMTAGFKEIHAHPEWLINPETPEEGSGAMHPAYFFDYSNPEFRSFFVDWIHRDLESSQYSGVFFDYIGGWALPAAINKMWAEKHPNTTYNDYAYEFLGELDAAIGEHTIFGNQTYRLDRKFYDYVDYDVSESYAVSFIWGKEGEAYLNDQGMVPLKETFYREWDGINGYKKISDRRRAAGKDDRVELFDINYLQPRYVPSGGMAAFGDNQQAVFTERTDRPAIYYGYAISKLTNGSSFASDWYATGYGKDDIYFLDLGDPVSDDFEEGDDLVVRYYDNGFVLATKENRAVTYTVDKKRLPSSTATVFDLYEGVSVEREDDSVTVKVFPTHYPLTDSYYPSGRVFMYYEPGGADAGSALTSAVKGAH